MYKKLLRSYYNFRSLVKIWKREAASKQMNGNYSALDSNFSCGVGGLDPGGELRHEPAGLHPRLYPNNLTTHQGGNNFYQLPEHVTKV